MADVKQRTKTFPNDWPHRNSLSAMRMAAAGFSYHAAYDAVECTFCGGVLYGWPSFADPMIEHAKFFSFCSFVRDWKRGMCNSGKSIAPPELAVVNDLESSHYGNFGTSVHIQAYVIAQYSLNSNPVILHDVQRNLQMMESSEFVEHVMIKISRAQREALMHNERMRWKSFAAKWPHTGNLASLNMARAGFYYVNEKDRVACPFCYGCLDSWEPDDDPMVEHKRHFRFCRFVTGLDCGNKSYRLGIKQADLQQMTFFNNNLLEKINQSSDPTDLCLSLGIDQSHADYQKFAIPYNRYKTYKGNWTNTSVSVDKLANAGFFYTGQDDLVRCFYCSGGLRKWTNEDEPAKEHIRHFPECSFAINQHNQPATIDVNLVNREGNKIIRLSDTSEKVCSDHDRSADMLGESRLLCKACNRIKAEFISLPCGHLLYCQSCNTKEKEKFKSEQKQQAPTCCKCQKKVDCTLRVFFS